MFQSSLRSFLNVSKIGVLICSEKVLLLKISCLLETIREEFKGRGSLVALAKDVVDVDVGEEVLEGVHVGLTLVALLRELEVREVAVGFDLEVEIVINEAVPVAHLKLSWHGVVFPISNSITNHETLKVGNIVSLFCCFNVKVKLLNKLWNVDASIRLS